MAEPTSNDAVEATPNRDVSTHREPVVRHAAAGPDGEKPPSIAVVEALAEARGVSPLDIRQPLYDVIDPDALDRLFDPTGPSNGNVVFSIMEYEVTVHSDGTVLVRALS